MDRDQSQVQLLDGDGGSRPSSDDEASSDAGGGSGVPHAPPSAAAIHRRRVITGALCSSMFGLGVVLSLLGPTLLDLGRRTDSDLASMGAVFTARSFG